MTLHLTGDAAADTLLSEDPFALLLGMLLDQQIAMEAAFANLVSPGDTVLVPENGYFGGRMASMAERAGGEVVRVSAPWGEPLDPANVEAAFAEHSPDVFAFVHAETSTGVLQPEVPKLTEIAH